MIQQRAKLIIQAIILIGINLASIVLEVKLLPIVLLLSLIYIQLYNIANTLERQKESHE